MLPSFQIVGFREWEDFIVRNGLGDLYTVPTVPCQAEYLVSYESIVEPERLKGDARFERKKYVKPIAFGGDAAEGPNLNMGVT